MPGGIWCPSRLKCSLAIPFSLRRIALIYHIATAGRSERATISIYIGINNDHANLISIGIRIKHYIEFIGCGGKLTINGNIAHGIQSQCSFCSCRFGDIILDDNVR